MRVWVAVTSSFMMHGTTADRGVVVVGWGFHGLLFSTWVVFSLCWVVIGSVLRWLLQCVCVCWISYELFEIDHYLQISGENLCWEPSNSKTLNQSSVWLDSWGILQYTMCSETWSRWNMPKCLLLAFANAPLHCRSGISRVLFESVLVDMLVWMRIVFALLPLCSSWAADLKCIASTAIAYSSL